MYEIFPKIMVTLSCLLAGVCSFLVPAYFWGLYGSAKTLFEIMKFGKKYDGSNQLKAVKTKRDEDLFFGFSIVSSVIMVLMWFCCAKFLQKRQKASGLLREACRTTCKLPSTALQPFIRISLSFSAAAFASYVGPHFLFLREPYFDKGFIGFRDDDFGCNVSLLVLFLLGSFYIINVATGTQDVVVSGVFAKWYFNFKEDSQLPKFNSYFNRIIMDRYSFAYSLVYTLRYNFGSVCFGSFLIPLLRIFRLPLMSSCCRYKEERTSQVRFASSSCCSYTKKIKRFLNYTTQYNYICMSTHGLSFLKSGKKVAHFLSKIPHVMSYKLSARIALFLAKTNVVFFIFFIGMVWFKANQKLDITFDIFVPIIIPSIIAFFVASSFFSMLNIALQTSILCYCDDMKRNNGRDKPYFAGSKLKKLLAKPRYRREGWTKTLQIPMREYNDSRAYIPTVSSRLYNNKRSRPRAAKGIRGSPNEVPTFSPQRVHSLDSISSDGSVQILVDRFDMFVDKMMHEREKSPLRNLHGNKSHATSSLPPINQSELPSCSQAKGISFQDQLMLLDVSDSESDSFKPKTPMPKPICFSIAEAPSHLSLNQCKR